jgi:hypothetical protein
LDIYVPVAKGLKSAFSNWDYGKYKD